MTDGRSSHLWMGKVSREENESDITDVFGIYKAGDMTDFERRFTSGIEDLGSALNRW